MVRETLSREQVIRAAIEVLDADGLEGLNMRRLGRHLGSAPTAVYWHVRSKDDLVVLAANELFAEIDRPDPDLLGWREAAAIMARSYHAMLLRHLWLVQAMSAYFVYGPGKASHDEHCVRVYERAGFAGQEADWALNTVYLFVAGWALSESAEAARIRRLDPDPQLRSEQMRQVMAQIVETVRPFPRLAARIESYEEPDPTEAERNFEWGLDVVFDGLEARLATRQSPGADPAS